MNSKEYLCSRDTEMFLSASTVIPLSQLGWSSQIIAPILVDLFGRSWVQ